MRTLTFIELDALLGENFLYFNSTYKNKFHFRFQTNGEALLILTAREEQGMIKQLEDKKVPITKIE